MTRWPLPPELAYPRRHPFVGRRAELRALESAWSQATAGPGAVVLVSGEAGVGKTTLVADLAERVRGIALYGRCDEDLLLPYQPFVEALRQFAAHADDDALRRIPPSSAAELVAWIPGLDERLPGLPPPVQAGPEATRYALSVAVRHALHAAAAIGPALVVLDDLHWATTPTVDLLRYVVTSALPPGLLLVGLYRDTDTPSTAELLDLFAQMRTIDVSSMRLGLEGLNADELQELTTAFHADHRARDDVATAKALQARTGGNPFFATELLSLLTESSQQSRFTDLDAVGVPDSVREVVGQRLDRLSAEVNDVLEVAAVIGSTFELSVLERVLGPSADVLDVVESAIRSGLVTELTTSELQFSHALVRETVRARLTASRLLRLHLAIGQSLVDDQSPARAQVVAHHLCNAAPLGDAEVAARWSWRAARSLLSSSGPDEAIERALAGLRALDLAGRRAPELRADLHLAIAEAQFRLANFEGRKEASDAAARAAREAGSSEQLALAAFWFGHYGEVGNLDERVVSLCEEALEALDEDDHRLRAAVLNTLSTNLSLAGDTLTAIPLAVDAVERARRAEDSVLLHETLVTQLTSLTGSPESRQRLAIAEEIIGHATTVNDRPGLAHGHRLRAIARLIEGDRAGFTADHAALARFGAELNDHFMLAVVAQWQAMDALMDGRFDEVEALGAEALAISNNEPNFFNAFAAQLFWLHYEQERLPDFLPLLEDTADQNPGIVAFRCALAMSYAHIGEHDRGLDLLDEICARGTDAIPFDWIRTVALAQLIESAAVLDAATHVADLDAALSPYSGELIVVATGTQCVGAVDRYLGMAALVQRQWDRAASLLDAAFALETKVNAPALFNRTERWRQEVELRRTRT